jgi:tetratricopeptide (TPR) repeat protein
LTYGSHRWLWENRFVQARAELALARSQYDEAIEKANEALERSHATFRTKYEIAALVTRGQARLAKGDHDAGIADLDTAHEIAQTTNSPIIILRTAIALLQVRGDDSLATHARVTARQISNSLPSGELHARFDAYVSEFI